MIGAGVVVVLVVVVVVAGARRRVKIRDEEKRLRIAEGEARPGEKRNSLFGRLNNLGTAAEQRRRLVDDAETIK